MSTFERAVCDHPPSPSLNCDANPVCSRFTAVALLEVIEDRFFKSTIVRDHKITVTSALPTTYKQAHVCPLLSFFFKTKNT